MGGIFGELLEEIAQAEGWQLHRVPCQWQECLQALQDGRIDLMPDVAWSEERSRVMDFHTTPGNGSGSLVVVGTLNPHPEMYCAEAPPF